MKKKKAKFLAFLWNALNEVTQDYIWEHNLVQCNSSIYCSDTVPVRINVL